jgi:hypothetical protein
VTMMLPDDIALLHGKIRGWNMLRVEWITRALQHAQPTGLGTRRVAELRDALTTAGSTATAVLLDPRFGRWCADMTSLIERDAPSLLPAGQFNAACRDASAFTLAARFLHAQAGLGNGGAQDTTVRVDHDGRVRVPGTGWVLIPGLRRAGLDITITVFDGRFAGEGPTASEPDTEQEVLALPGLVVAEGDPVDLAMCAAEPLMASGPAAVVIERGLDDLRIPGVPGLARVPARANRDLRARHALAAAAHLRAVAHGARLFEPGSHVAEPPPEVAHLATGPQLVRLLALYGSRDRPRASDEAGRVVRLLAAWLASAESLSPLGNKLLAQLVGHEDHSRQADAGPVATDGGDRSQREPTWRASWAKAGGSFRQAEPAPDQLTSDDLDLTRLIAELGGRDGIEVNRTSAGRPRADPTIDQLSLIKVRTPERYAAMIGRLAASSRCLAEEIPLAHQAYAEERFPEAAAGYAALLLRLPDDIDLWRDLAFALRHLGATELCETVLFRLAEVVRRAEECEPDAAVLDSVCPPSSRWRSGPSALRYVCGLIEWVEQ